MTQGPAEMPRSARWVHAALGVFFLLLGGIVLWVSEMAWGPALGAILLAVLGLDLVVASLRDRWPLLTGAFFLP